MTTIISNTFCFDLVGLSGFHCLCPWAMGADSLAFFEFPETFPTDKFFSRFIKKPALRGICHDYPVISSYEGDAEVYVFPQRAISLFAPPQRLLRPLAGRNVRGDMDDFLKVSLGIEQRGAGNQIETVKGLYLHFHGFHLARAKQPLHGTTWGGVIAP